MMLMQLLTALSEARRLVLVGTAALLLGLVAGCSYSHGDPAPTCDIANETITYAGVVSPLFDAHCRQCHGSAVAVNRGGGQDFGNYNALNSYPNADYLLRCIKHAPGADPMPQAQDKLSDCDIGRIEAWIKAGKPNN